MVLPAALPQIFTGVRIGLGIGWMALVAGELELRQVAIAPDPARLFSKRLRIIEYDRPLAPFRATDINRRPGALGEQQTQRQSRERKSWRARYVWQHFIDVAGKIEQQNAAEDFHEQRIANVAAGCAP